MNISDINTPSDLVQQNNTELSPEDHVIKGLTEMTYSDTRVVFDTMVETFIDLHCHLLKDNIDKGNVKGVVTISQDLQTLWTVKKMMKGV
jgi:hypothetical protein